MDYAYKIAKGLAFPLSILGIATAYAFRNPNLM